MYLKMPDYEVGPRCSDDDLCVFIDRYLEENRYAPSIRDVMVKMEVTSTSTVAARLNRLRRQKRVDWADGQVRTLHTVRS